MLGTINTKPSKVSRSLCNFCGTFCGLHISGNNRIILIAYDSDTSTIYTINGFTPNNALVRDANNIVQKDSITLCQICETRMNRSREIVFADMSMLRYTYALY